MDRITGSDALGMMEAYNAVYAPQELTEEQVWEEVEVWVNSLVEEGYDLSDYTWEDMYDAYLSEAIGQPGSAGMINWKDRNTGAVRSGYKSSSDSKLYRNYNDALAARNSRLKALSAAQATIKQNIPGLMLPGDPRLTAPQTRPTPPQTRPVPPQTRPVPPQTRPVPPQTRPVPPQTRPTPAPAGTSRPNAPTTPSYSGATGVRPVVTPLPTGAVTPVAGAPAQNAPVSAPTTAPTAPARTFNPLMQRTFGYQTGNSPSQLAAASAGKPIPSGTALGSAANPQVRASLGLPALPTTSPAPTTSTAPVTPTRRVVTPTRAPILQRSHFDPFDVVMGYLIDEGYAENEEAASVIMANMSEEWRQSIVEQSASLLNTIDTLEKKVQKMNQRQPGSANLSRRGEQTPAAALYKAYGRLNGV